METLGELTLAGHRFPIRHATFRRITDDGQRRVGWEFEINTQPPVEEPADDTERFMFANGVRFDAEGDPIPLPDVVESRDPGFLRIYDCRFLGISGHCYARGVVA